MKTVFRLVFRLVCFVLAVTLASLMFFGWSEPGLRLLLRGADTLSGGMVSCGSARGALLLSFQLEDLSVTAPAVKLRFGSLGSSWQLVELFHNRLHVASLTAGDVEVMLLEQEDSAVDEGEIVLPRLAVPVLLMLDKLTVENFRLLAADFSELTRIDHLSFGLSGSGHRFQLNDFFLSAPGYGGKLQGLLDTEDDWYIELSGDVEYKDYGVGPVAGTISLKGPIGRLDTIVDLRLPARGHIEGQIRDLPDSLSWSADLALYEVQLADTHSTMPEMLFTVSGKAEGELLSYGGTLKGELDYLFFQDVAVELQLNGNGDQIEFTEVTAANEQGKARLTDGLLSWKDDLVWHGRLELFSVDPALILAEYPGAITADLLSSGSYGEENGLVLDTDFKAFSGILRGYELAGHGRLQVDANSISLDTVQLESGNAVVQIDGRAESDAGLVNWRERLTWTAGVRLANFDPALFFAEYPGNVNTEVNSKGTIHEGAVNGQADIVSLDGELRGYPIKGKGAVRMADQIVHVDDLLLQSGRSTLNVAGTADDSLNVVITLVSENIGEFLEGAKGSLNIDGKVHGDRNAPLFKAEIAAKGLSYDDAGVDTLQVLISGGTDATASFTTKVQGRGLYGGSLAITSLDFNLDGTQDNHTFSASLKANNGDLQLRGNGVLADDFSWAGGISNLNLLHPAVGSWKQGGKAVVAVSQESAEVDKFCLKSQDEKICFSGDWDQQAKSWNADVNWQQIDLARLNEVVSMPQPVTGRSNAQFSASGDLVGIANAKGVLEVHEAGFEQVAGTESEWDGLQLDNATLKVNLQNEKLKTDLAADFADGSVLGVTSEVLGVGPFSRDFGSLGLRGGIHTDLQNIEFVAPLTNYFVRPSGSLRGDFDLSGTVQKPVAKGKVGLTNGQLELPEIGITMKDVQFAVTGTGSMLDIEATASSGPGTLQVSGNLLLNDNDVAGDFRLTGENIDTAMLPEYEIRTTPDLHFTFNAEGGKLTGRVDVPHAVIAPERMTDSLSVSEDVIILDDEAELNANGWQFATSLKINLGDDVKLEGYGLTGYLRGNLLVDKKPGSHMTGKGQLSLVDGIFSIYGRTLSIERSRVMFTGGPIDNPGVDVRAKKIVADNKKRNETIVVGVEVSGTADDLQFALFSDPHMEESDILAYMVVGRSRSDVGQQDESMLNSAAMAMGLDKGLGVFDEISEILLVDEMYIEGGSTDDISLVVGKNLTEELFIGYGHNFFDQQGEVRIRYDLGSGFSVESRSSGEATGADLLYSFEK